MSERPVLMLAKTDEWCDHAAALARMAFGARLDLRRGRVGDPVPGDLAATYDAVLSFLCPWVLPPEVLARAPLAINFHPASRDYPGIGCYNFALYEEATEYGAICHHMAPQVDSGAVILERRFPMLGTETVADLKLRTMVELLALFHDMVVRIAQGQPLPRSRQHWSRRPFRRRELEQLCETDDSMSDAEVARRVRATTFPGYRSAQPRT